MQAIDKVFGSFVNEAEVRILRLRNAGATQYSPEEVLGALEQIDEINSQIEQYNLQLEELRDRYADDSGLDRVEHRIGWIYERAAAPVPSNMDYVNCQGSNKEPYPVKRWLADVAKRERELKRRIEQC